MAATPTFTLSGGGDTVLLSKVHAPEEFDRPTEIVPTQVRKKLSSGSDDGLVYLLKGNYQQAGQTLTTNHRYVTPAMDAVLKNWNRTKDVITYDDGSGSSSVVVLNYKAKPRTVLYQHTERVVVDELKLLFF